MAGGFKIQEFWHYIILKCQNSTLGVPELHILMNSIPGREKLSEAAEIQILQEFDLGVSQTLQGRNVDCGQAL